MKRKRKPDKGKRSGAVTREDGKEGRLIFTGDTPRHGKPAAVLLRLPISMHKKLKQQAHDEGVPMSQHILRCLAEASMAVEMGHKLGVVTVDEDTVPVTSLPTKPATPDEQTAGYAKLIEEQGREQREAAHANETTEAEEIEAANLAAVADEDDGFEVEGFAHHDANKGEAGADAIDTADDGFTVEPEAASDAAAEF